MTSPVSHIWPWHPQSVISDCDLTRSVNKESAGHRVTFLTWNSCLFCWLNLSSFCKLKVIPYSASSCIGAGGSCSQALMSMPDVLVSRRHLCLYPMFSCFADTCVYARYLVCRRHLCLCPTFSCLALHTYKVTWLQTACLQPGHFDFKHVNSCCKQSQAFLFCTCMQRCSMVLFNIVYSTQDYRGTV